MQTMQHYATLPNSSITTQLFLLGSLFSDVGATQVPKSYIVLCFRCVNQIHLDTTGFNCLHQRRGRDSELLKPVRFIQIWHEITGRVKIVSSKVGPLFSSTNVKIVVTRPNWARKPYEMDLSTNLFVFFFFLLLPSFFSSLSSHSTSFCPRGFFKNQQRTEWKSCNWKDAEKIYFRRGGSVGDGSRRWSLAEKGSWSTLSWGNHVGLCLRGGRFIWFWEIYMKYKKSGGEKCFFWTNWTLGSFGRRRWGLGKVL